MNERIKILRRLMITMIVLFVVYMGITVIDFLQTGKFNWLGMLAVSLFTISTIYDYEKDKKTIDNK